MPKKKNKRDGNGEPNGLWVAARYSLKGPAGERAWENRIGGPPNSSRFLELADIALGLKKPTLKKRSNTGKTHDVSSKKEPYKG